jgi:hypothetical protein
MVHVGARNRLNVPYPSAPNGEGKGDFWVRFIFLHQLQKGFFFFLLLSFLHLLSHIYIVCATSPPPHLQTEPILSSSLIF